jgi:hypothetical protein
MASFIIEELKRVNQPVPDFVQQATEADFPSVAVDEFSQGAAGAEPENVAEPEF